MTQEVLKLALEALTIQSDRVTEIGKQREAITAIKEALREHAMREVQRLGQEIEQEPVALPCCGYADASAVKWNSHNQVVQCHNCGQIYTTPPQRTWVGLTDEDRQAAFESMPDMLDGFLKTWGWLHFSKAIEAKLKEKNT